MKRNAMRKNLTQTIKNSITRYIAIVAIIALGAAIFVGLRTTKFDMVETGQRFMDKQNMFDLRLLNSYGWNAEHVSQIKQIDGVVDAEGLITMDVIGGMGAGDESVYKLYSIPTTVNKVLLLGGRMPEKPNECLADGSHATDDILGTKFIVSGKNEDDTLDSLKYQTFTVVGYVSTPLFMDMSRGTTTLGNGSVASYVYIPEEAFDVDYYTEIGITIPGDYEIYTDTYHDAMEDMAEFMKPLLEPIAMDRFETVKADAQEAYEDGLKEYQDGLDEYQRGKFEADNQLEQARQQLLDAQAEIDRNKALMEDGKEQLKDGQETINDNAATIASARKKLMEAKADAYAEIAAASAELLKNYQTVSDNLKQIDDALAQIVPGLAQIESGITQLEEGISQLDLIISMMDTMLSVMDVSVETAQGALDQAKENEAVDPETLAKLEQELQSLIDQKAEYEAQRSQMADSRAEYSAQLEQLKKQRDELKAQKAELESAKVTLDAAMAEIENGFIQLQNSQAQAEMEFAEAEAKLESGQIQLDLAQIQLNEQQQTLQDGLAELEKAQEEVNSGWEEYWDGYDEAKKELSDALLMLTQAQAELKEAKQTIDDLTEPDVYALTRTASVSYLSLDSNSDIVAGISAVFPAFFLLIAALVCITTMTRMVDEERTQIGTLKALGYSNGAIIGKYLAYAGSAAILGCGLGVVLGSVVFPIILWEAYNIILNITPSIVLLIDWPLCLMVVGSYTAVTLGVTWYCCRSLLREVPAELIRPKPPTTGKKIFLEYLPFWNRFSFLNKVMLRNVFRYRQRLLMMLVGIGGCTALLVTGFGVKDSIVDIVSYQFQEVTRYDMEVRFSDGLDLNDQAEFREEVGRYVDDILFVHQSSVEIEFEGMARDVILIASDDHVADFVDFHDGNETFAPPQVNEALLSVGLAQRMGVKAGDLVTIRNSDLEQLTVTITGIYDNNVYNYIYVHPDTIAQNWVDEPEQQMAFICVKDTQDVHYASTKVAGCDGVMNVTVSEDLAEQVGSMLEALNLVVITVVICAGMLAVTVLYNLTNINITERLREIATIKVLGFNASESAAYVFKENLLLSAMGTVCGLFMGKALLAFVVSQIKVDMVWFQARVLPMSYVWAIVLTILSAVFVDFVLYFKLEKINMAEALKSVE